MNKRKTAPPPTRKSLPAKQDYYSESDESDGEESEQTPIEPPVKKAKKKPSSNNTKKPAKSDAIQKIKSVKKGFAPPAPATSPNGASTSTRAPGTKHGYPFVMGDVSLPTVDLDDIPGTIASINIHEVNKKEDNGSWRFETDLVIDRDGVESITPLRLPLEHYHEVIWAPKQFARDGAAAEPGQPFVTTIPLSSDKEQDKKIIEYLDAYRQKAAEYICALPREKLEKMFGPEYAPEEITPDLFKFDSFWKHPVAYSGLQDMNLRFKFENGYDKRPKYLLVDETDPNNLNEKFLPNYVASKSGLRGTLSQGFFYVMRPKPSNPYEKEKGVAAFCGTTLSASVLAHISKDEMARRASTNDQSITRNPDQDELAQEHAALRTSGAFKKLAMFGK